MVRICDVMFAVVVSVVAARRVAEQKSSILDEHVNHTYGDCHCAFTSSNKASCCSKGHNAGMGTGNFCGNAFSRANTCGGGTPVCCTSHAAGSVCCPGGSSCTTSCRGDGGRESFDGGRCQCLVPPMTRNAAQKAFRFPVLKMFATLARASYCGPDGYSPNWQNLLTYTCPECRPANLRLKKDSVVRVTRKDLKNENATFAYLAKFESASGGEDQGPDAPRTGDCIVSFAGSINVENWKRNVQLGKKDAKTFGKIKGMPNKSKFHKGFLAVWIALSKNSDEGGVVFELEKMGCGAGSDQRVFVTGQSLGAATASIAMADLRMRNFNVGLSYIFNAPRVGNKHVMKFFRTGFGRDVALFRRTHGKDPIVRVGPSALGYRASFA